MKFLIVEDDPISQRLLEKILSPYGTSEIVNDGEEAVQYFTQKDKAHSKSIDFIFLDINMPKMDGQETLAHIRAHEEKLGIFGSDRTKIIMTTVQKDSKNILHAFTYGCDGYIVKPYIKAQIYEKLRSLSHSDYSIEERKQQKILIADDDSMGRKMLARQLKKRGYNVEQAEDGVEALNIIKNSDTSYLIIADWMMPRMSGPELCIHLKGDKSLSFTYIILLTGKEGSKNIIEGLRAGADDYVNKPYNIKELEARIKAGQRIINLERTLLKEKEKAEHSAEKMEQLAKKRAEMLVKADKMVTLGTLSAGIAHEINNPTTFISGNIQLLEDYLPYIDSALKAYPNDKPNAHRMDFISEELPELIKDMRSGTDRIANIVKGLKSFVRQDTYQGQYFDIHEAIEQSLLICNNKLKYQVTINKQYGENLSPVFADRQQTEQVIINLLTNAADAVEKEKNGVIVINTSMQENYLKLVISDNGTGIPENILNSIWNPFYTTKPVGKGTGLGLSITKGIIENAKGQITVKNLATGGAEFTILLKTSE